MGHANIIKRNLLWTYLNLGSRFRGVAPAELARVRAYLDRKFRTAPANGSDDSPDRLGRFPGLTSRPVYEASEFAWVAAIEAAAGAIKREYEKLREQGVLTPHPQDLADSGEWNTYYLYSNGVQFTEHCRACPETTEVLRQLPGGVLAGQAYFSVMAPGTHVRPHRGPTNTRLRCHLGLTVPASSCIRVDNERLRWTEGRCIVFDDALEHEVWNPDGERAVFIVDVWHPELTEAERWALQQLSRFSGRNRRYRHDAARRARRDAGQR